MDRIVVGIDPDTDRHGVAIYEDGLLKRLCRLNTVEIVEWFDEIADSNILFSIENTLYTSTVYARNRSNNAAVMGNIGVKIGRVQQAQVELMRWLEKLECSYVLHKPQRNNWADDRRLFERITGWNGSSNKDTRSAAFFGFLASTQ